MVRAGVIGVGAMGQNHARIYSELPDVELVGVADIDVEIARTIGDRFGIPPFQDYKELLKQQLDAISIVVPTSMHREVAVAAALSKVNMLVEKPIADSVPAAKEIIETCQTNGVKLMIGHVERFNPVVSIVMKEMEKETTSLIEITRIGPFPPRIKDVGIVIDLATHDIDLIRFLTGSEFKKAFGLTSRSLIDHEDVAILAFEMANGTLARITTNWLTPFKVRELTVATKKSFIKASLIDQTVTEYTRFSDNESYLVRSIKVPYGEPLKLEIEAFLSSIKNDTPPPITGNDGLRVLEVLNNCGIELSRNIATTHPLTSDVTGPKA